MTSERILTVSTLTAHISSTLEGFGGLLVRGEIAQVRLAASGHYYATLKDREAVISLVCWRSTASRLGNRLPKEGDEVVVRGRLGVYGQRGQYQLMATAFRPVGAGDLAARFEELKRKLETEGLFAEERKRPLPFLPRGVGVATGSGSAAEADILESISMRFPTMLVSVVPCLVQGRGAAESICAALAALDEDEDIEVIILGRGGGSLEDLWAFNEEVVVRAIARCRTPVISAVGHETDHSLADLAADQRAKTPTAAGELVVPVAAELRAELQTLSGRLHHLINARLRQAQAHLRSLAAHRALATPRHQLLLREQRLDDLSERLGLQGPHLLNMAQQRLSVMQSRLRRSQPRHALQQAQTRLQQQGRQLTRALDTQHHHCQQRFTALVGRLDALSPLAVIARGYAVLSDQRGQVVRHVQQAPSGSRLVARVHDGVIEAQVTHHHQRRLREASDLYLAHPPADEPPA